MVVQTAMKKALQRVRRTFDAYAKTRGWGPADYRLLLRWSEDWGYIKAVLVGKDFPGRTTEEQWARVMEFVEKDLKDEPPLKNALGFTLAMFDQLDEALDFGEYIDAQDV
jgi:hypothetical protein